MLQVLANRTVRMVGTPVLIGAAYFAHPAVADFLSSNIKPWCGLGFIGGQI